ncbi:MAG TPA: MFS transporter [bacterium]|nr:MFS transporter [bacterium]HOK29736.1 MFS transporter [bacterium]HOL54991.1 MFS transporter [bacterium]HPO82039.1 MFS transporter [bacterium]HRR91799.1 MFS transporter [bacterium]
MFNVIILGIVSLLTDISTEMVYPLVPLYLTAKLGASPAIVGLIEGVAESTASLLRVFSGYISDLVGRRKPLAILGYGSSTIGKIFLYLSNSWGLVFIGRWIDRFGKGIRTAPRDALIADSTDSTRRGSAFGLHRAMDTLGAATGVLLAYYFLTRFSGDYSRVFLYSLIPAFLGVAALLFVRETKKLKSSDASKPVLKWSLLDRRLKGFLIVTLIFTLGNSSNQFLLLRAKDMGFNDTTVLLLYLAYNIVYMIFAYPAGRLSDRIGRKRLIVTGYLFYGLVYLGFAIVGNASYLWLLFGLYGIYIGLTEGVQKALISDIAPVETRATLIGLHATLEGIGLLPASFIAGLLWNTVSASAAFYFGGAMGIIAAVGMLLVL